MEEHLQFPCEDTTLYGHWNPLNVDPNISPRNYHGTPDQYEMGDLSGKFGSLDNQTVYKTVYNDSMLPLFGPRAIVGRSIIIHKRVILLVALIKKLFIYDSSPFRLAIDAGLALRSKEDTVLLKQEN